MRSVFKIILHLPTAEIVERRDRCMHETRLNNFGPKLCISIFLSAIHVLATALATKACTHAMFKVAPVKRQAGSRMIPGARPCPRPDDARVHTHDGGRGGHIGRHCRRSTWPMILFCRNPIYIHGVRSHFIILLAASTRGPTKCAPFFFFDRICIHLAWLLDTRRRRLTVVSLTCEWNHILTSRPWTL